MIVRFWTVVRIAVTAGLLAWLVHLLDVRRVGSLLGGADLRLILGAVALALADRFVMVAKWYPLLRIQAPGVSFGAAVRVYLASGLANYVLPASVGADVLRVATLGRDDHSVVEIGASVVAERVLGMIGLGLMSLVALGVGLEASVPARVILPWSVAAVAAGVMAIAIPTSPRVTAWLCRLGGKRRQDRWFCLAERFAVAYAVYRKHPRTLAIVAMLSFLEQGLPVLLMWVIARSLGVPVGFEMLLVAVPLASFAARLPISIGGLGVGDAAFAFLVAFYGLTPSHIAALLVVGRAVEILVTGAPAIVLWRDLVHVRGAGHRQPVAVEEAAR